MIVWVVGTEGDQRLHGYDGDTGAVVYAGGGANELMAGTHSFSTTGIAALGRIYVATDNKVYAFRLVGPIDCTTNPNIDFDHNGKQDYLLYNASTRRTAIWYMNNNVFVSGVYGPTPPAGWSLVGVADFNGDGKRDYLLFNSTTRQSAIWYLNNNVYVSGAYGPTLPSGWQLMGTADFNGDGKPDYVLYNASTRQTAIWYMNNNVFVSGAYGPSLPAGWNLMDALSSVP